MSFLLDTNVISEVRRPRPSPSVAAWFAATPASVMFVSVMTMGEIRRGVEQLRPRDPGRAAQLDDWFADIGEHFRDRIVAVDIAVAQAWGRRQAAEPQGNVDGLIAATALVRGWTVVTRNVRDFERSGVPTLNPFAPWGE